MFDYSDFKAFRSNYENLVKEFDGWLKNFMKTEGQWLIRGMKAKTPVDTGLLRESWDLDEFEVTTSEVKLWFINSAEYSSDVEWGHAKPNRAGVAVEGGPDWVDGRFMMTLTLEELEQVMPSHFNTQFRSFLTKLGVL